MPLPRVGVRLALPAELDHVTWYGHGPGEGYRDSRAAVRVGRWSATVDAMQTPYVYPQENGHRVDVRWATLTDGLGRHGIRFEGAPTFGLTARRWTTERLDAARHPFDLVASSQVFVNLDLAHHGLGSASCGPDVLALHRLEVGPARFTVTLSPALAP
jgi:beta-galactosidase